MTERVVYTRQAKISYLIALTLFGIGIAFIILDYFRIECLVGGAAFSLAFGTAQMNGHFTQFGKKKRDEA